MFIVSISYTASLQRIDQYLVEHVAYLDRQYALGNFVLSGRKEPRTGGVILAAMDSQVSLRAVLSLDPFYREQLADFEITEFYPSKAATHLSSLLADT